MNFDKNVDLDKLTQDEMCHLVLRFLKMIDVKPRQVIRAYYHSHNKLITIKDFVRPCYEKEVKIAELFQMVSSFCAWDRTIEGSRYWRGVSLQWRLFLLHIMLAKPTQINVNGMLHQMLMYETEWTHWFEGTFLIWTPTDALRKFKNGIIEGTSLYDRVNIYCHYNKIKL